MFEGKPDRLRYKPKFNLQLLSEKIFGGLFIASREPVVFDA